MWNFPLFPDQASTMAQQVDALYFFELGIAGFFTALICVLIVTFAVRYRQQVEGGPLEPAACEQDCSRSSGSACPLILGLAMFTWGAILFYRMYEPPG